MRGEAARTAGHVLNGLLAAAHAQHGALHGLHVQVLLLARDVVGAHDAHLRARAHLRRMPGPQESVLVA